MSEGTSVGRVLRLEEQEEGQGEGGPRREGAEGERKGRSCPNLFLSLFSAPVASGRGEVSRPPAPPGRRHQGQGVEGHFLLLLRPRRLRDTSGQAAHPGVWRSRGGRREGERGGEGATWLAVVRASCAPAPLFLPLLLPLPLHQPPSSLDPHDLGDVSTLRHLGVSFQPQTTWKSPPTYHMGTSTLLQPTTFYSLAP